MRERQHVGAEAGQPLDVTEADEPCPSATIAMTAATPITMPSVVRTARPLFARSASSADGMLWVKRSPPRRRVGRVASTPKVTRPVGDAGVAGDGVQREMWRAGLRRSPVLRCCPGCELRLG